MTGRRRACALATLLVVAFPGRGRAAIVATPGSAARVIAAAAPRDTVVLAAGIHPGPLVIGRPLTLIGAPGAVLDGGGRGTVLDIVAGGAVVENLAVRGSGSRVITVDATVRVRGEHVRLTRLAISDALYGINAERATGLVVEDCRLAGRVAPGDESGSGNGIHLWYTSDATVRRDTVEHFLDGIYLSFTERTHIESSLLQRCGRYGLHTMYCPSGRLIDNRMTHNVAGCAIMFSNHLSIERNEFSHNRGARTYGLLLRDCSDGSFVGNRLVDNTVAVFMDGSNRNELRDNLVQDCGWGVLLFSSCEGNTFAGNAFVNDDYPVALDMRFTRNRFDDGRTGNYWSENAPYDLDADGVSDTPYAPVSTFAFVSKQYPDLAILAHSPAVAALTVAERVVPSLRASEAVDRFPRVRPPDTGAAHRERTLDRPRASWRAALGFAALAAGGVLGIAFARRAA